METEKAGVVAQRAIEQKKEVLETLARNLWEHPETAFSEVYACEQTAEILKEEGFEVETGCYGLPTAIRASFGSGKPVIGLLGEYDALPGMSQKIQTDKEALHEGAPGHACGHNLLGAGHLGAAIGMKKEMEERNLSGTVVFYGCPGEEQLTGKGFMARAGAFKELDVCLAWHPDTNNRINMGTISAMNSVKFHFKGITAHAGGDPQNGRSALDAAELMNVGANFLREHVTSDVRIHYILTEAGSAPNIVPDKACNWYFVRAFSREMVESVYERLIKVAKGAAQMTETSVDIEYLGGCYPTLQNSVLAGVIHEVMEQDVPVSEWTEEEKEFAEKLNQTSANYEEWLGRGYIKPGAQLEDGVWPVIKVDTFGSTDVGDVQHMVPGIMFNTATTNLGAAAHSWQITACAGSSVGRKGMIQAAKIMAAAGIRLLKEPSIIEQAKEEFIKATKGKAYRCPITEDIPVPEPQKKE